MKITQWHAFLLLGALFLNGCNTNSVAPLLTPTEATTQPSSTPQPATRPPQASQTPMPDPIPDPVLVISGEEEVVFDWTTDRCSTHSLPDLPFRAFRDVNGQVQAILSHDNSNRMLGPDLNTVKIDCNPIMESHYSPDPALFIDAQWVAAPYTEDGQTVYALVHNEYQGHTHPGQCPQNSYFPCWDNSITLAVSLDAGRSYSEVLEPPAHLVARFPYPYEAGAGPEGFRNPSNIIKGPGDYYYSFFNVSEYGTQEQWVCLMRTEDLSVPSSWRFWDGNGFEGQFVNPYQDNLGDPEAHICAPLAWDDIGASLNDSITYNTYLERFVLVGVSADWLEGREVWGVYYSFSKDLIEWTHRKLLVELTLPWTAVHFEDVMYLYPSLLDPESESRNFETTDQTAYLYYTRHNFGQGSLDRDLIRVPVQFFPSDEAARIAGETLEDGPMDALALSIAKQAFTVPAGTPLELTLGWEAKSAEHVGDFLANAQLEVTLDGEPLLDAMDFWGEIKSSGDRFSSQWLFPIGILDPGEHLVDIQLTLSTPITDGLGNEYSGTIFTNTLQIEVED